MSSNQRFLQTPTRKIQIKNTLGVLNDKGIKGDKTILIPTMLSTNDKPVTVKMVRNVMSWIKNGTFDDHLKDGRTANLQEIK